MSETYYNEVRKNKAKNFFLSVLKNEGRPYILSDTGVEILSEILTNKLLAKFAREKKSWQQSLKKWTSFTSSVQNK